MGQAATWNTIYRGPLVLCFLMILLASPLFSAVDVVATTPSTGVLVRSVGGDQVKVTVLAPPDRDAHYLQAKPSMILALRRADLLVSVGAELEAGWLPAAISTAANPKILPGKNGYFEAAAQIPLIERGQAADRGKGDVHPQGNPHVYLDPLRMAKVAQALAVRLGSLVPGSASQFKANADRFVGEAERRVAEWRKQVAGAPGVLLYHKDANYLMVLLGVPVLGYIEPIPGVPPTGNHLRDLVEKLRGKRGVILHTVFQSDQGPKFLARNLGWTVAQLPLEPAVDADATAYFTLVDRWVKSIAGGDEVKSRSTLLSIDRLVAGYDQPVVGPVSLTVCPGEVVGIEGPNGSGKSTILSAVTGEARIFSGVIERAEKLTAAHQQQRFLRLPEMPILGRELLHLMHADRARKEQPPILRAALDQRLDRLSGGQLQLIQVWACLGGDAQLVLLDEPTNNMDPAAVAALTEIVGQVEDWRGVLVVSHENSFLRRVCDRIISVQPVSA